ncbi:MAG TPA: chemotaxis protein CheB [Gemmatimonadaceae bacterium]|nr:chemotaxis protein CheB [Gemmatimonadaceae bacterium]
MPGHDIIVIGGSAGGVEAVTRLAAGLPRDIPAAVFVVLHFPAEGTSVMPRLLTKAGKLPAAHAVDGEPIEPGRIYVAAPDRHLLLRPGEVRVTRGPRENGHRPALDPLFRSAAIAYGPRVVGVVLSGNLDDGSAGLVAVKRCGGVAVVQDPGDALFPGMPQNALAHTAADHVLPLHAIADTLDRLAREPADQAGAFPVPDDIRRETDAAALEPREVHADQHAGHPSGFGCPDCGGALWELREGELVRFRCRVGHAWSGDSLLAEQRGGLETALWTALRALEENASLALRLLERAKKRGQPIMVARMTEQGATARTRAELIRRVLAEGFPGDLAGRATGVTSGSGEVAVDPAAFGQAELDQAELGHTDRNGRYTVEQEPRP